MIPRILHKTQRRGGIPLHCHECDVKFNGTPGDECWNCEQPVE